MKWNPFSTHSPRSDSSPSSSKPSSLSLSPSSSSSSSSFWSPISSRSLFSSSFRLFCFCLFVFFLSFVSSFSLVSGQDDSSSSSSGSASSSDSVSGVSVFLSSSSTGGSDVSSGSTGTSSSSTSSSCGSACYVPIPVIDPANTQWRVVNKTLKALTATSSTYNSTSRCNLDGSYSSLNADVAGQYFQYPWCNLWRTYSNGITMQPPYTKDISTPVCIVSAAQEIITSTFFYPQVDSMTLLQINNSDVDYHFNFYRSTRFRFEIYDQFSPSRRRFDTLNSDTCSVVIPFWTVVITLNGGDVTGVDWDNDCSLCDSAHCIDGTCGVDRSTCVPSSVPLNQSNSNGNDCNVKIYVSWTGTDSSGNVMTSASRRLSQFRRWSLSSAYSNAYSKATLPSLPTSDPQALS